MSEVILEVLKYLFSKDVVYVWACCFQDNIASKKLIEKMEFEFMQEGVFYSGSFAKEIPSYEYRMSKDKFMIK